MAIDPIDPSPTMASERTLSWLFGALVVASVGSCEGEKPPAPDRPPLLERIDADKKEAATASLGKDDKFVLTFAAERGKFTDSSKLDDVPEASRGLVRVALLGGDPPPAGQVWVANLRTPGDDGRYVLKGVPRDMFEELALGQGLSSEVTLPEGLEPPEKPPATATGEVIVYKTAWCGVCKKVEGYLKRKGVEYVAKDIEKDREAAAELQAKAKDKGVRTGSVPIIDVGGELIVGFDRDRLEKML